MERTYRMYGLVPYNISPIQQGIQFGHALQEYNNLMLTLHTAKELYGPFNKWRKEDKTFIILNGGTTNSNPERFFGTLNKYLIELTDAGVMCASFREPDLGDQLTAIVFLVDDRVFDRVTWPDYAGPYYSDTTTPIEMDYWNWKMKFAETEKEADLIIWLRDFLKNFKFA